MSELRRDIDNNRLTFIFNILLLSYVAVILSILKNNAFSETSILVLVTSAIWLIIAIVTRKNSLHFFVGHKCVLWLIVFLSYVFLDSFYYNTIRLAISHSLIRFALFIGMFMFLYFSKYANNKQANIILLLTLALWIWACIELLVLYYMNPGVAIGRDIASHMADITIIKSIGSPYAIAQGLCFISVALFYVAYSKRIIIKRKYTITMYCMVILFSMCIIQTQSTITIITEFLSISLVFLFSRTNSSLKKIILFVLALSLFLLLKEHLGQVLINHFNISGNWVSIRLNEIGRLLSDNSRSQDILSRLQLAVDSFYSFTKHPLTGQLFSNTDNLSGNHCELLDTLSNYGLLGGVPFFMIFISYYGFLKKRLRSYNDIIWIPLFITAVLNPLVLNQCYFAALFVVPLILFVAENTETQMRKEN